jgi:hypothetical protein
VGLTFGTREVIGYDTTILQKKNKKDIFSFAIGKNEYMVLDTIFLSETMRGHATQCFLVWRDMKEYVLKDSWCLCTQKPEPDILQKLEGMEGVPHLINSEDIKVNGQVDSTATCHVGIHYKEERVHRHLVIGPVAKPLHTFETKKLIQAFIDIVKSMFHSYSLLRPPFHLLFQHTNCFVNRNTFDTGILA